MSNGNTKGLPWIGVDLDATLAEYDVWRGIEHIGKPIPAMVDRIKQWISQGHTVKIFTARVCRGRGPNDSVLAKLYIQQWLVEEAGLPALDVTNEKDFFMIQLWDDRCTQVVPNTGLTLPESKGIVALRREDYDRMVTQIRVLESQIQARDITDMVRGELI